MKLWIVRVRLYLPERLQRKLDNERERTLWTRNFWKCLIAANGVVWLNASGMYLALHGHGKWSVVPAVISTFPLVWLLDKAAFAVTPAQINDKAVSDIPELVVVRH